MSNISKEGNVIAIDLLAELWYPDSPGAAVHVTGWAPARAIFLVPFLTADYAHASFTLELKKESIYKITLLLSNSVLS